MKILLAVLVMALSGCAMVESDAGKARYRMEPVIVDGKVVCCAVDILNAKNIGKLTATADVKPDGSVSITLEEEGVDSAGPMGAMVQQNTVLLDALIKSIPQVPRP